MHSILVTIGEQQPTPTPVPGASLVPSPSPIPVTQDILPNGSFEIDNDNNGLPDRWVKGVNLTSSDKLVTNPVYEGIRSFMFIPGSVTLPKQLSQKITRSGNNGDVVTFSAWSKSDGALDGYRMQAFVKINYIDGTYKYFGKSFPLAAHNWQKTTVTAIPAKAYSSFQIILKDTFTTPAAYYIDKAYVVITPATSAPQGMQPSLEGVTSEDIKNLE